MARHRRASGLRATEAARGRTASVALARGRAGRTAAVGAAGVMMLGAVFGLSGAAPDVEPADDPRTTAAGATFDLRPDLPVVSRGQARAVPAPAFTPDEGVELRAAAPELSPSPTPIEEEAPPPAAAPPPPEDAPEDCDSYSGNRLIACAMLDDYGFGVDQMPALDNLWTRESGWNELAQNPSSGAYGIPQSLPGDKMASCGDDWRTNPATQICWGLGYIKGRYGNPDAAWAHSEANGWY